MIKWHWYFCILAVCAALGSVIPQLKDEPVTDFSCITHNWVEYVICTWNYSKNIQFEFVKVYWMPVVRYASWYHCPEYSNTSCKWNIREDSINIQRVNNISIKVNGQHESFFLVKWNESVQPDPVINLEASAVNSSCIVVRWEHTALFYNKTFNVKYHPLNSANIMEIRIHSDNEYIQEIKCGLTPFTKYEVEVSCKPIKSGYWSKPERIIVVTNKTVPALPPDIYNGGYSWRPGEINDKKQITFYWTPLDTSKWNGENIQYEVHIVSDSGKGSLKTGKQFFLNFEVESVSSYNVKVWTRNEVGNSSSQTIKVPLYKDLDFVINILGIRQYNKDELEIFWKPPEVADIKFYRLFWCEQVFGDICKHPPSSMQVSATSNNSIVPGVKSNASSYLFGVSYTTTTISSGFVWSDCYIDQTALEFPFNFDMTIHPVEDMVLIKWRFSKCTFSAERHLINKFYLQMSAQKDFRDYTEYVTNGTSYYTSVPKSTSTVCVRVFPEWHGRKGKTSSATCIDVVNNTGTMIPLVLSVGSVFLFFALFGCCMIARKIQRLVKKFIKPNLPIETPVIYSNNKPVSRGDSGQPLLET